MGKRIDAALNRTRTNKYLDNVENNIKGREAKTFSNTSKDPFDSPARDNYQVYPYDYFSGADCKIFFGDIWVDDIITLQYNVNQDKTPIYGYASQLFDTVAKGQVLVQGQLSVAFKEVGYLNLIQGIMESQKNNSASVITSKVEQNRVLAEQGMVKFEPRLNYFGDDAKPIKTSVSYSPNGNPQIIRQEQTIEQILAGKKAGTALSKEIGGIGYKSRDFEDFAEVLEDSIWGDSNGNAFALSNKLKRVDEFDYSPNGGIITAKDGNYANVLNILLTFGDINDFRAEHTMVALNDVHFVSSNMIVSPNGDPIAETYTFFARNVNESLSNEVKVNINPIKLNVGNDNIKMSKLSDISNIENYLNTNPNHDYIIVLQAALDDFGWNPFEGIVELNFSANSSIPFVDQIITAVEKAINTISTPEVIDASKSQYIIKLVDNNAVWTDSPEITMVLDQSVINTRTYKVISPARTGFNATPIITREEMYGGIKEMEKPLNIVKSRIDKNKAYIDASKDLAVSEKEKLNDEYADVGLADEKRRIDDLKDKEARLNSKTAEGEEVSKFNEYRLDRNRRKLQEAEQELDIEYNTAVDDRSLNRQEKQTKVELNLQYQANQDIQDRIAAEETNLEAQEQRYNDVLKKEQAIISEQQKNTDSQAAKNEELIKNINAASQKAKAKEAEEERILAEKRKQELEILEEQLKAEEQKRFDESLRVYKTPDFNVSLPATEQYKQKQYFESQKINNTPYGVAVSSSVDSHKYDSSVHAGDYRNKVALDVGNISVLGINEGYAPAAFGGKVIGIGSSSFTVQTDKGNVTYAHIANETLKALKVGSDFSTGEKVYYEKDHYHVQANDNDWTAYDFESEARQELNAGYRNTVPTSMDRYESMTRQDIITDRIM